MLVKRKRRKRLKPIVKIIIYIIIFALFFNFCEKKISLLPDDYLSLTAKNYLEQKVNSILEVELAEFENTYSMSKGSENELSVMKVEVQELSLFQAEISQKINKAINGSKICFIPIGSLLDYSLLGGHGFLVPVKMSFLGSATTSIQTELMSSGINQSVYRLILCVNADIITVSVKNKANANVLLEYPICEVYIVGDVPNYRVGV